MTESDFNFIFGYAGSLLLHAGFQLWRGGTTRWGAQASHCGGFSCRVAQVLRHTGFSRCSTQARQLWLMGSRVQAQQLWHTDLAVSCHVESFWTRDQTCPLHWQAYSYPLYHQGSTNIFFREGKCQILGGLHLLITHSIWIGSEFF